MLFVIAVLLIHPQVAPQKSFSAEKTKISEPANTVALSDAARDSLVQPPLHRADTTVASAASPGAEVPAPTNIPASALPEAPVPVITSLNSSAPDALLLAKPIKPNTVSVDELRAENRFNMRIWTGLVIASSSAATFDAWTTRHALTTAGAQELDPLLKPFAGNASLYVAIQAGPALMDFIGKKMMYSRHGWIRNMWWVPQSASLLTSVFCGGHNLAFP